MSFTLSREELEFRALVREVAGKELAPLVEASERSGSTPRELWRRMGALGFLGVCHPVEVGGSGGSFVMGCLLMEELYRIAPGIGAGFEPHVLLGTEPLRVAGTSEQIDRWLRPALNGEAICAFAMTEPEAGSDAGGIRSTATLEANGWVLEGVKTFVTNGGIADFLLVTARTERGISLFVVERGDLGFSAGPPFNKLGLHASVTSPLYFDSCRLPRDRLLGEEGRGLELVFHALDKGRVLVAAESLGIARASFSRAVSHAKVREQFGRPISAARRIDAGERCTKEAAMAKLFASEMATKVAHAALLTLGGSGYMRESEVERHYRDAILNEIVEGTSDIQRIVIARELGL